MEKWEFFDIMGKEVDIAFLLLVVKGILLLKYVKAGERLESKDSLFMVKTLKRLLDILKPSRRRSWTNGYDKDGKLSCRAS